MNLEYKDILAAKDRIEEYIYETPLEKSIYLSSKKTNIYLKLENQQKTKSAKLRGALSKLTSLDWEERKKGIVAISSGNHGAAVTYASNLLGINNVNIYLPKTTPKNKVEKIKYFGGQPIAVGENYDQANRIGKEELKKSRSIFVDPSSDNMVIAGQGSIAVEILQANPLIDTILVPIGGGGIITGVGLAAKAIKPGIKIIGLQTEACPAMVQSLKENKFYETYPTGPSICDALVGGVGHIPYKMASKTIDEIILVGEKEIGEAVSFLIKKEKIVVEPAGAIGVAALMNNYKSFKGKNLAIILTGGNIDEDLMLDLLC